MSQPRVLSAVEAFTNVAVGFCLAICVQVAAFPAFGIHVGPRQHLGIGAVFTAASLARSYALRRVFDRFGRA
jgi:hypothetical protein